MKTFRLLCTLLASWFVFFAPAAHAAALTGNLSFPISGAGAPTLWDFSGSYSFTIPGQGLSVNMTVAMTPDGKYTGTATVDGTPPFGSFSINSNFSGTVAGSASGVALSINLKGTDSSVMVDLSQLGKSGTANGSVTAALTLPFKLDASGLTLDGMVTGSAQVKVPKQEGVAAPITKTFTLPKTSTSADLVNGMNGSWTLKFVTMNLDSKNKYTGTGQIVLSNNTTFNFNVTGTYAPSTGVSTLTFKCSEGFNVTITGAFTYNSGVFTPVKPFGGKVAGQSIITH